MTVDPLGAAIYAIPTSIFAVDAVYNWKNIPPHDSLEWPHVRIGFIASRKSNNRNASDTSTLTTTSVSGETQTYSDGDEFTVLDYTDVDSITSLTASATVPSGQPLVEGTDYELGDSGASDVATNDAIEWLAGATVLPADGATLTIDYERNVVTEKTHINRLATLRAVVHAKDSVSAPRDAVAMQKALELEAWLEHAEGTDIQFDGSGDPIILDRIVGNSRPGINDDGESIATWVVDFTVKYGAEFSPGDVQRVRKVPYTTQEPDAF